MSLSAFSFLFSELVQYHRTRASSIAELEQKLSEAGEGVGSRMLEVLAHREKSIRREIRLQGILQFINTNVWRCLFGKVADSLEIYNDDEYVLGDKSLVVNRYISVPSQNTAKPTTVNTTTGPSMPPTKSQAATNMTRMAKSVTVGPSFLMVSMMAGST